MNTFRGVAIEVAPIESQHVFDSMAEHEGDVVGIVDLSASNPVANDQTSPTSELQFRVLYDRGNRETCGHFSLSFTWAKTKTVDISGARQDRPQFSHRLRRNDKIDLPLFVLKQTEAHGKGQRIIKVQPSNPD